MENTHEWCGEGVSAEIENLKNVQLADFPWVIPKIKQGEVVAIDDVRQLPAAAAALQGSLDEQEVKSCLLMPVWVTDQVAGFTGLDNTRDAKPWHSEDVALLRVSSNLIGSTLTRQSFELAEQAARRHSEALREAMVALTANLDLDRVLEKLLIYLEQVIPYDGASVVLLKRASYGSKQPTAPLSRKQ